jgi:hypothetical protein
LLANKPFLQEQVVRYVDQTFSSGSFVYDQVKCERDIGLIVDSIAMDLLQESESESIFAGLQYWRQSGYVDAIGDQISTTTDAINYVKTQAISIVNGVSGTLASTVVQKFDLMVRYFAELCLCLSQLIHEEINNQIYFTDLFDIQIYPQ